MDEISHRRRAAAWTWETFLDDFIERESAGKSAATRRRYGRVRDQMLAMFDEIDLEDQSGPGVLVECLSFFLGDDWLMASDADARTQVSLCDRLLTRLRRSGAVTPMRVFRVWLEADSAVFQARARVRNRPRRRDRERAQLDRPRLRLIRGGLDAG